MIMLSATPHDGRAKSFASLMNMLDPTAIANPEDYTKDDIKGLCIRRFKENIKDQVNGAFLERTVTLERCHASAREERAFNLFADMELQMDIGRERGSSHLFKTSLEKSLFSSPAACIKSIDAVMYLCYLRTVVSKILRYYLTDLQIIFNKQNFHCHTTFPALLILIISESCNIRVTKM